VTRSSLIALGAFAIMAGAIALLVLTPQALLRRVEPPPQLRPYTAVQARGRAVYQREGCVYCHSQQVRDPSFTTDIDRGWGTRATVPADYVYDRPHFLGTMRTGPDLVNVGARLPSLDWHLIHLYDPRSVVEWSIMPSYRYLFEERDGTGADSARVVNVPGGRLPAGRVVVASPDAVALAEYLLSLSRQYPVDSAALGTRPIGGAQEGHR
jgi:cytochrome c oxidase cbb3-type subunit II